MAPTIKNEIPINVRINANVFFCSIQEMIYARKITRKKEVRTLTTTLISADSTTNPGSADMAFPNK